MKYDYLIVGSGLFGCVFARLAKDAGKSVLVLEKREHVGGNIYTQEIEGINVHKYGAHIFHTNNDEVWKFINNYISFNNYKHTVLANYKGEIYNLPFNMNTFKKMWNVNDPEQAKTIIAKQSLGITNPSNLEEQCISMVGSDIYQKLVKGYTEKQWGRDCKDLPSFIIKRLPLRFVYDNSYFDAKYQGIPIGGYTKLINNLLEGIEVKLNYNFLEHRNDIEYSKIVYTGAIDEFYDYKYGYLEYRSVKFETEILDMIKYQDNSVVNYTERDIPYTRIIEHKHFENSESKKTIITKEYPSEWCPGKEPYYPVNDEKNMALYNKYKELSQSSNNVLFGGRLGEYKYYDMDGVIEAALKRFQKANI